MEIHLCVCSFKIPILRTPSIGHQAGMWTARAESLRPVSLRRRRSSETKDCDFEMPLGIALLRRYLWSGLNGRYKAEASRTKQTKRIMHTLRITQNQHLAVMK